jgi:hypothetical protein
MSTSSLSQHRRGKIARLPRQIRDQLNLRLDDGHEASEILPWLNDLPEVRQIIADHFDGVPISPQNLSAWRNGGFQEWLLHRQFLDSVAHTRENLSELQPVFDMDEPENIPLLLADQLITQMAIRMNVFIAKWGGNPPDAQMSGVLKIGMFLLKLQQRIYRSRREAIELPALEREVERKQQEELESEVRQEFMLQKLRARKAAREAEAAESSPIKPNQGSRKKPRVPSPPSSLSSPSTQSTEPAQPISLDINSVLANAGLGG